jgi:putative tricarboxylic transport membrane protein
MTETLGYLAQGFDVAFTPINLALVFAGCLFGTMIGALPGIGPVNGVAILLPFAYSLGLEPASAIMLLAGVYYGAEYGGRISSILLNIPGDAGAVMTTVDGHPLAKRGQGDRALAVSAVASFIGSMVALLLLVVATPILVELALAFGPAEYVVLVVFAFSCLTAVARARPAKVIVGVSIGLFLAIVGIDSGTGIFRFTFGIPNLFDGVDFLVVIIGVFAISEVFAMLDHATSDSLLAHARPHLLRQFLRVECVGFRIPSV